MCLGEPSETVSGVSTSPSVSELPRDECKGGACRRESGSLAAAALLATLLPVSL